MLTDGLAEHADVVFPAESYAEKEGTVTHPDGRLQRVRRRGRAPAPTRPGWRVIAELARAPRASISTCCTEREASQRLFDAVPFYAGLTLEEIGGRGVRWQERARACGDAGRAATAGPKQLGARRRDDASPARKSTRHPAADARTGP